MGNKTSLCKYPCMRFLKKLRESRGLTAYGMAKLLGMIPQTYLHYETKAKGIQLEILASIREKLELTWEELGKMIDIEVKDNNKKGK